jgi:hypothetical protein
MRRFRDWLDNPILVKHIRSRLRKAQLLPAGLVVLVLTLLIGWMGSVTGGFDSGSTWTWTLSLQGVILVILGASQVATTVASVRESGILDFHRISPLHPAAIALGFFFGAPIREYVLYALTFPLALACVSRGVPDFGQFLQFIMLTLLVAWTFHALAMIATLITRKPTRGNAIGVVALLFIFGFNVFGVAARGADRFVDDPNLPFFGAPIHWLPFAALYLVPIIIFALMASTRKVRSDRLNPLSKPQALVFQVVATVLVLGGLWTAGDPTVVAVLVMYLLVGCGLFLALTITPKAGDYARGQRRAVRLGRHHLPFWHDLALNRAALAVMCLLVLTGVSIGWNAIGTREPQLGSFSLAIAVGVLTVGYFGLMYQTFTLIAPKRAGVLQALALFLLWVVPMLIVAIAAAANLPSEPSSFITGLSPITGLGALGAATRLPDAVRNVDLIRMGAIIPAITLPIVFNNLVVRQRRKIDRAASSQVAAGSDKPITAPDELEILS